MINTSAYATAVYGEVSMRTTEQNLEYANGRPRLIHPASPPHTTEKAANVEGVGVDVGESWLVVRRICSRR